MIEGRRGVDGFGLPLGNQSWMDFILGGDEARDQTYSEGAFDRRVDYRSAPIPPLTDEDSDWVAALLQAKGNF